MRNRLNRLGKLARELEARSTRRPVRVFFESADGTLSPPDDGEEPCRRVIICRVREADSDGSATTP